MIADFGPVTHNFHFLLEAEANLRIFQTGDQCNCRYKSEDSGVCGSLTEEQQKYGGML
nr:MAG: hypothetical protein J07AB56_09310 [Candidatus Nanosalinarum sp. J07AB56]